MTIFKKGIALVLALVMLTMAIPFGGLTAFAAAIDAGVIYLNTPATAVIESEGITVSFTFTPPKSGMYSFRSYSDDDTRGYLYTADGDLLASDDDGAGDQNFMITEMLEAGVTYKLQTRYYNYEDTGSYEVKVYEYVPRLVESVEFHTVEIPVWEYSTYRDYDPETGEYISWKHYQYLPHCTVYYTDGTSEDVQRDQWIYDDEGSYYIEFFDDQAYNNQWGVGEHTVEVGVPSLGIEDTFTVSVEESPVASVEVPTFRVIEGTEGHFKSDSLYDENDDYIGESPEYFWYYIPGPSDETTVIHFKDGSSITGNNFYWNNEHFYIDFSEYVQDYENQWTVGNTYPIHAEIAGYEFDYYIEIVESPVASVEIPTYEIFEGSNGYYTTGYRDENHDWISDTPEYFYYYEPTPYYEDVTIVLKDGTVINDNGFELDGKYYDMAFYGSDQDYYHQWTVGNTYQLEGKIAGFDFTYDVSIVETPIASVTVDPIIHLENEYGSYTYDSYYDEETGEWVNSPEYFKYETWIGNDQMTIVLKDGTVIENNWFEWNGEEYGVGYTVSDQNYDNQWTVGNTYQAEGTIAGYKFTYDITISACPIASVTVTPVEYTENHNGWYTTDSLYDESDNYIGESPEYFYYHTPHPYYDGTVITLTDGTVINANWFEWNGREYHMSIFETDQSYENRWTAGNTYELRGEIMGFEFTFEVSINAIPIASVDVKPIQIIENTDGYYKNGYWDNETGEFVDSPEYYYYHTPHPQWEDVTITLTDGTTVQGTSFEWNGSHYDLQADTPEQTYENQWSAGNTYQIQAEIAGFEFTYDVEIIESPVDYVEVKPIVYYEGTNGEIHRDEYWDVEKQEWIYSPEYFRYHFHSGQFVVHMKDGTVFESANFEWNGRDYWLQDLENEDNQSYDNPWTAGNTYSQTRVIAGYVFDFEVTIAETPIESVVVNKVYEMINRHGYYRTDPIWDEHGNDIIGYTPEYFHHYTPYPDEGEVVITLKDGTVINNYGFYLDDEWVSISIDSIPQSYDNQIVVGQTYTVDAEFLGYKFTYECEFVESPVASVEVDPMQLLEGLNGEYRNGYWGENGWVETPEYFYYYIPHPDHQNTVITLTDGTVINGTWFEWNGDHYSINVHDTNQSYENQWTAGNSYEISADIAGYKFTYTVDIVQLSSNDSFEYMESGDGVIITDSFIAPETLEIPTEINGKPVTAVAGLSGNASTKHLIFPDSVRTIGDYLLECFYNLETVTFGSGVRNLQSYMFYDTYRLREITVAEDNEHFCTVDGVLYDKAMTAVLAFPIQKGNTYEVPKTVVNIDALDASIYSGLSVSFAADHPYFITVDGVTYNKDMTKVLFCAKDKAGSYTMPDTVTEIAPSAFEGCDQLTEVIVSSQVTEIVYCVFSSCASLEKVDLPSGLVSIDERAFEYTEALEEIELPETLEYIGRMAFMNSGLTALNVPDSVYMIDSSAFEYTNIATLDLGNGITEIYSSAFAYTPVTAVILPDSLEWLGGNAFRGCGQLKSLHIGSSLDSIQNGCFAETGLEELTVPNSIYHIGSYAFSESAIAKLTLNEGLEAIENCAFMGCANLTEVTVPASVSKMDIRVFADCDSLVKLTVADGNRFFHSEGNCIIETQSKILHAGCGGSVIPTDGSVLTIGNSAFYDSDNLETIAIPDAIVGISHYAFYDCDKLHDVVFPETLAEIGYLTFAGCDSITEIVIPDGVYSLYDQAFFNCNNLASVVIGDGIQEMGIAVFAGCPLTSVDLGSALPYINEYSFMDTALPTVFIPDSVTSIMYGAFMDCSQLTSIELPLSVESIHENAFAGCESLTDVYYEGTEADRENVYIGEGNEYLLNATWHYGWTNEKWDGETTNPDEPVVPPVTDRPLFIVDGTTAKTGNTFTVAVRTENNSGIVSLLLDIGYDANVLELIGITGKDFSGVSFGPLTKNPIAVNWCDAINPNNTTDGTIALLTFKVKDDAVLGPTTITVTYNEDNVYDFDLNNVVFNTQNGTVEIIDHIPGDANDDGSIDNKDFGIIQRYLARWDVDINLDAADVNDDGVVNNKDLGILQRYINRWDVELK